MNKKTEFNNQIINLSEKINPIIEESCEGEIQNDISNKLAKYIIENIGKKDLNKFEGYIGSVTNDSNTITQKLKSLFKETQKIKLTFNQDIELYLGAGGFDVDGYKTVFKEGEELVTVIPTLTYDYILLHSSFRDENITVPLKTYIQSQKASFDILK